MPDESFAGALTCTIGRQNALHDGLTSQILLVTGHNLNLAAIRRACKDRVEAININKPFGLDKESIVVCDSIEVTLFTGFISISRAPFVHRSAHTGILNLAALT